jgi:hypothetical protein
MNNMNMNTEHIHIRNIYMNNLYNESVYITLQDYVWGLEAVLQLYRRRPIVSPPLRTHAPSCRRRPSLPMMLRFTYQAHLITNTSDYP